MAQGTYDIITVGGGLGGSTLAKVMAERGARVLVLERERQFRDSGTRRGDAFLGCCRGAGTWHLSAHARHVRPRVTLVCAGCRTRA
jgi:choline dehydrogenase-like flavoprotein